MPCVRGTRTGWPASTDHRGDGGLGQRRPGPTLGVSLRHRCGGGGREPGGAHQPGREVALRQPGLDARLRPRRSYRHRTGAGRADRGPGRSLEPWPYQAVLPAGRRGMPRRQRRWRQAVSSTTWTPAGAAYRHSRSSGELVVNPTEFLCSTKFDVEFMGRRPRGPRAQRGQQCLAAACIRHHGHARHCPPPGRHDPHQPWASSTGAAVAT